MEERMSEQLALHSSAGTHVGQRRKNNEDAYLMDDDLGLWVVADGMGGQAAGEVASQQAVETVHEMVRRGLRPGSTAPRPTESAPPQSRIPSPERLLESAIQAATYMVYSMAELDRTKAGMGTTLSAMLRVDGHVILGQVGDSRIYRVRAGSAEQLTEDHTLINWQLQQGIITEEEAKTSKQKNVITRAVGNRDYVQVDVRRVPLEYGDIFLLCSDGLHGYLGIQEIAGLVQDGGAGAVQRLIDLANSRGGKDNITVALVEARSF